MSLSKSAESVEVKNQIHTVLKKNNYPTKLINILYNRVASKLKRLKNAYQSTIITEELPNKKFMSIHFVPGLSERIARNLESEIENLSIAFRTRKTLNSIYRKFKDKTPKWQQSNVIYCIRCKDCGKVYVGKTEQHPSKNFSLS
jgi:hypothetical protein